MPCRFVVAVVMLATVTTAGAQALIPGQMHNSFVFELHSVQDEVLLYAGDPQFLLKAHVQPSNTLLPHIDFSNTNQSVVLRLRDLSLFEPTVVDSIQTAEDIELGIDSEAAAPVPLSQVWEVQLAPACAGDYVLTCEGGKGLFDFTDLPVHEIHLLADSTEVAVEFKRPNSMRLDRFKLTTRAGQLQLSQFLNARPLSASLQLDDSVCEIELTGKAFQGTGEIFVEGVPKRLKIVMPRNAGIRVEGPSGTVARFDHAGMVVSGAALESKNFASQTCRLRLYFSRVIPKLDVQWGD